MSELIQYEVRWTENGFDDSSPIVDLDAARSYQRYVDSAGDRAERFRRTVTYGEWEIDSD